MPEITIYKKRDWSIESQYWDTRETLSWVLQMVSWNISDESMNIIQNHSLDYEIVIRQIKKEFANLSI